MIFWVFSITFITWFFSIIPGVMNYLSDQIMLILTSGGIVVPAIVIKRSPNSEIKFGWTDWLGLTTVLLILYAIKMRVDPIELITAIRDFLGELPI